MADDLNKLFEHIVRSIAVRDELLDVDFDAAASEHGDSIQAEKQHVVVRESDQARKMRESFHIGLTTLYRLKNTDAPELRLSDQDGVENSIADALIRYLVSFDLAESRTEEPTPGQFVYHLSVHWDALQSVASEIDLDLEACLEDLQ
ncbi:hypothetical protein BH23CHL5_BH23CHL5_12830 [soil metagenome]